MYSAPPDNKKQKIVASFIAILAVVLVTAGARVYDGKQKSVGTTLAGASSKFASQTSSNTANISPSTSTPSTASTSSYRDGTYAATSSYYVPHGDESIKVTLTIERGIVTGTQVQNSENDRESAFYQEEFASQYKSYVVGKSIAKINLSYIAGASDTTQGFNDALDQIKSQAQA